MSPAKLNNDDQSSNSEELQNMLVNNPSSFIKQHIRRTIGQTLSVKNVTYEANKMIQLVRHEHSRRREDVFKHYQNIKDENLEKVLNGYAEVVQDYQVKKLNATNQPTRMEKHLKDVFQNFERLSRSRNHQEQRKAPDYTKYTLDMAQKLQQEIKDKVKKLNRVSEPEEEAEDDETVNRTQKERLQQVEKKGFFKDLLPDQKSAGKYLLSKLNKDKDNDQLLMLLHGPPGTGKSFFIKRLKNFTSVNMKITATSGIAAMSLNGTTIDWLINKGYSRSKKKVKSNPTQSRIDQVRKNLGKSTLIIIDESSMMGCSKFIEVEEMLRKAKGNDLKFGGLDILLVGDFAQLLAVRKRTLPNALINSSKSYMSFPEEELLAASLFGQFKKFELKTLYRSKGCTYLKQLLLRYRDVTKSEPSITMKDLTKIGVLKKSTFRKDKRFKEAPILVTTRQERSELTQKIGQR